MGGERAGEGTASLEKALDVLEAIGASREGIGHLELAERLGMPKTTVYRILGTLVARGMVWRDPFRHVYCLGARAIQLARKAYSMPDLVAASRFELRTLRDVTGETTYLAAMDGADAVSLERCEGAHSTRSASMLGVRKPLYCTSQGKAMLSALPDEQRNALVSDMQLKPLTDHTITDRRVLKKELQLTAQRGYAIDDEEIVPGVRCVGAPIIDPLGQVRGSISIAGPAFRMTRSRVEQLGPDVAEAARRIGAQLGVTEVRTLAEPTAAVTGSTAGHGAMPCWSIGRKVLYWADTVAPAVHALIDYRDRVLASVAAPVTALALHRDGVLVAHKSGWHVLDEKGKTRPHAGWPGAQLRALCVRPGGELWGAMETDNGESHIGTFGPAGDFLDKWHVDEGIGALAWGPSGDLLYASGSRSGSILVLQSGTRSVRRLASMPKGSGNPAGLAVDSEGGIWTALVDGWSVVRFSHEGVLDRVVALPVPRPTDVAFGGPDLETLYVTTSRDALARETLESAPLSGRLFEVRVGVSGAPEAATA